MLDLKDHAGALGSAGLGRSVHVAGSVEDQVAGGMESVGARSELMNNFVGPARPEAGDNLKSEPHPPPHEVSVAPSMVVPYRLPVASMTRPATGFPAGVFTKLWSTFSIQRPLVFSISSEHNAISRTALVRGAVEIASGIEDQIAVGIFSVATNP